MKIHTCFTALYVTFNKDLRWLLSEPTPENRDYAFDVILHGVLLDQKSRYNQL